MGSGISTVMGPEDEGGSHDTAFGDLPESCVAGILMGFDPVEICRLARVNRTFRRAASADFIWEEKLPENYGLLMETVLGEEELRKGFGGKIGIYSRLCQRNLFDGGKKVLRIGVFGYRIKVGSLGLRKGDKEFFGPLSLFV